MKRLLVAFALLAGIGVQAQERGVVAPSVSSAPQTPAVPVPIPPPVAEAWLPRTSADLAGLDKITARLTPLTAKLGETISFGSLRVTMRNCMVRAPDQPADQAVFLDVTDIHAADFAFHGWMVLSDPALAVLEHPVYDIKLVGCR